MNDGDWAIGDGGEVWVVGQQNADISDALQLRDVAMAISFWLSVGYDFSCVIASVWFLGWVFVVKLSHKDIAKIEVLMDVVMATIFGFLYMGCTLAQPGKYDWTDRVRRRCGLMSNYFDHLLLFTDVLYHLLWMKLSLPNLLDGITLSTSMMWLSCKFLDWWYCVGS